ncbi:cobalamin biosynthesis protein CobW [Clostridiales bacterium S5-A14a]|nr:cobalamin biosynthesis protein CobW [Clostridiales bacterium S5-A14a]
MTNIDIFSGFLGAGKTTLIRKLIQEAYNGEKIVLIENEFGEIGIDGGFLKDAGIEINEMNSGCICCTLVGDFSKAIEKVIDEFKPDRILIEPSGVGKLSDVILAVKNLEDERIHLNSFTTIVDGRRYEMYAKNFGEFYNNQVEHANTVIISHAQDLDGQQIDTAVKKIRELNKEAPVITTDWDELDGSVILKTMEEGSALEKALEKLTYEVNHADCDHEHGICHHEEHEHDHNHDNDHHHDHCEEHHHEHDHHHDHCEEHHHEHDHHHDHCEEHHHDHDHDHNHCEGHHHDHDHHGHGHHHADEVFDSIGIETSRTYEEKDLESMLSTLKNDEGFGTILRAKGILQSSDGWLHFDLVPGDFEIRKGSADVIGRIVAIGTDLDKGKIKELFKVNN